MADNNDGEVIKPPPEPKLFKIFCNPVNTKMTATLVESLQFPYQNNQDDRNVIVGSTVPESQSDHPIPKFVRKTLSLDDGSSFTLALKECDVIIFDLMLIDLKKVEYAIKTLTYEDLQKPKILILISSVRIWAKTAAKTDQKLNLMFVYLCTSKVKKGEEDAQEDDQEEEGDEDIEPEPEPEPDLPANPDDDGKEKPEYQPFRERDYILRRTYSKFQKIRAVETLGLAAGKSKSNLHTYVVCPGIPYGLGEEVLFNIFRQSWLQDPPFLTSYGHGRNKLPTIHFKDIAMHVKFIIYKLPKKTNYVFAIDHTKNRTQKRLLKAIGEGIGVPTIKQVEIESELYNTVPDFDLFTLDLWMKPSSIFKAAQLSQEENQDADDNADDDGTDQPKKKLKLDFSWWCQGGIPKNIAKLCKEFNECRAC